MTVGFGIERPIQGQTSTELLRAPASTVTATGSVTGQTISLFDVTTSLTVVTTTIYASSYVLPKNQPIANLGCLVTGAGVAVTAFWQALIDSALVVRAVTANTTVLTTGFFNQPITATAPYVTPYGGLFYHVVGCAFTTTAPTLATATPAPSAAVFGGPPVYAGTSATAATATPPAIGTTLGALTGAVGALFYGQTS